MKDSKFFRVVDRHVGSVLCWGVTLLLSGSRWLRPKERPIKKILVIELFEMGASVMIAPSLSFLKEAIPQCELHVITYKATVPAWKLIRLVPDENIHALTGNSLWSFAWSTFRMLLRMRRIRFDLILDYNLFLRFSAILSGLIPAQRRAGFYKYELEGLYRGNTLDRRCYFNQNEHIAKNFLALAKTALRSSQDEPGLKEPVASADLKLPKYQSNEKARREVTQKLEERYPGASDRRLLVVSHDVGPVLSVRNYPQASFAEALKETLTGHAELLVILVGTRGDWESAENIRKKVASDRCLNFCGKTDFEELMELLSMAKLVVSNDNGIAHFSSVLGKPSIALFSTDSPYMYGPLGDCTIVYAFFHCSPCIQAYNHKRTRCVNNVCLQSIAPKTLASYIDQGLAGKLRPRTINNCNSYLP